jgi:hypothetical protein
MQLKEPSPEARALAGLAADLFDFGLLGLLCFAFVNVYAPNQDLPWKPLQLNQPLGYATTTQLERTVAAPTQCMDFLQREGIAFRPVPDRTEGGFCTVRSAGVVGPEPMRLSPASPVMTCRLTAALALWTKQSVIPAARELLGSEVVQVDHYGTYSCRRIYGQSDGRVSQHAHAEAVDIAAFRLADGRRIDVLRDWNGSGPEAAFLRRVRDEGCRLFRVVLSPEYNAAHANHLHFDMSPYRLCR